MKYVLNLSMLKIIAVQCKLHLKKKILIAAKKIICMLSRTFLSSTLFIIIFYVMQKIKQCLKFRESYIYNNTF